VQQNPKPGVKSLLTAPIRFIHLTLKTTEAPSFRSVIDLVNIGTEPIDLLLDSLNLLGCVEQFPLQIFLCANQHFKCHQEGQESGHAVDTEDVYSIKRPME
jgi:hypothetical protein